MNTGKKTKPTKQNSVKDDSFYVKKNDIDAMRHRPTMYIGSLGAGGVFHLCKEIIDNNNDECIKTESPGNRIDIVVDDHQLITRDNGRGIPTSMLRIIMETNQAGSNMTRSGGMTKGENGSGLTAYTAMSSFLEVVTLRPTEKKKLTVQYEEGELVKELLEDYDGKDGGLITTFKPSKKILGTDKIPVDMLLGWLKDFDYTLPASIKMTYTVNGKENIVKHKTLSDYFSEYSDNEQILTSPLAVGCDGKLEEIFMDETFKRSFKLDAVLVYMNPETYKGEDIRYSWMNMIHTPQNGSHVDGVVRGYTKYITEKVIKKNKKLENEDIKKDVLAHLSVVVNASCDFAHMFSSQAKHTVFSKTLGNAIANAVYDSLSKMDQRKINDFVEIIIANHRVRVEGEKARDVNKMVKPIKKWVKPESYLPCSNVQTEFPKELFLVEGKSARGGLRNARDGRYQAILMFRGKSLNIWDVTLDRALASIPWRDLVQVLECGIGNGFDIKKLAFDKIIIATDADIDGYHIRVGFCAFFLKFLPEIIRAGKLYIAEPPLYQIARGKEISYVATQTEYINACIKSIGDISISTEIGGVQNATDFITDTFDYLETLERLSIERCVNRYLLEYVAYGFVKYGRSVDAFVDNVDKWIRMLVKIFPELGFDHKTKQIHATIDLVDQLIVVDDILLNALNRIIDIQERYGLIITFEGRNHNKQSTSLSRFFEYVNKLYPVIKDRYKGLGSSAATVSKEVIMDPRTRRITRVTIDDVNTMLTMGMLVGDGKDNKNMRKEMLMNYRFTKADIDN